MTEYGYSLADWIDGEVGWFDYTLDDSWPEEALDPAVYPYSLDRHVYGDYAEWRLRHSDCCSTERMEHE